MPAEEKQCHHVCLGWDAVRVHGTVHQNVTETSSGLGNTSWGTNVIGPSSIGTSEWAPEGLTLAFVLSLAFASIASRYFLGSMSGLMNDFSQNDMTPRPLVITWFRNQQHFVQYTGGTETTSFQSLYSNQCPAQRLPDSSVFSQVLRSFSAQFIFQLPYVTFLQPLISILYLTSILLIRIQLMLQSSTLGCHQVVSDLPQ